MQTKFAISGGHRTWLARVMAAFAVSLLVAAALPASAQTLDRIREAGRIKLGYMVDARPFTVRNEAGTAEGYSVTLCQQITDRVKTQLNIPSLAVEWVPVTIDSRLREVQQGNIDLLCAPVTETLARRQDVAFSIPVFPGGVRAVVRNDAAAALREALEASRQDGRVVWRGSPAATVLGQKSFAVVAGTTTETWLAGRLLSFRIDSKIVPVADHRTAVQQLLDREVDAVFGDRALVLGAMDASARESLTILPRLLTHEPLAFALARGDDDFRLLVDRTLSESYASAEFGELYAEWCGEFDDNTRAFFLWNTLLTQ
jgi:ABC-type amino acid transport substrate-binding protein